MMIDDYIDRCLFVFVATGVAFLASLFVGVIVYLPANLVAEARCLEAGYPRAAVTWNFKQYCKTVDGQIRITVESLDDR